MAWQVERQYTHALEESESSTSEAVWKVFSQEGGSAEDARAAFIATVNPREIRDVFGGRSVRCRVEHDDGAAGRSYTVTLSFASSSQESEALKQGKAYWCDGFSTAGGSSRITQGHKEKRFAYNPQEQNRIPDCEGRVSWNGEEFEGVDIITPNLELTYKQRFKYWPFMRYSIVPLAEMTGTVNKGPFCGFGPGNVLFTGASGTTALEYEGELGEDENGNLQEVPTPYWDVTFNFKCHPSRIITVGGQLAEKRGFDYAWQLYDTIEDTEAGTRIQVPRALYITEVYTESDFSVFGF